jgi:Ni/Co efflux regulator RcnB
MKKVMMALLAFALFIPALALAQNSAPQDDASKKAQQEANQAAMNQEVGANTQPHHMMSGMVSDNGKHFTSGNTTYVVSNPHKLKDYDGKTASIEFQFNSEQNTIKVDKVSPAQSQP